MIIQTGTKTIYSANNNEASKWVREPLKGLPRGGRAPNFSSGLKVKDTPGCRGTLIPNSLGYMTNQGNSPGDSVSGCYILSSCSTKGHGVFLHPLNFRRCIALFAARKLVLPTWLNDKDEYLVPDVSKSGYEQWVNDCLVFTILHHGNNCCAIRNVTYQNTNWNISNPLFWLSYSFVRKAISPYKKLFDDYLKYPSLNPFGQPYIETKIFNLLLRSEPYMAYQLSKSKLSNDAKLLLKMVNELWVESLPTRIVLSIERPELHLHTWDAGIYQLKHLWKEYYNKQWKEIQDALSILSSRLAIGVYEYGFLLNI
jgi:hypothetical protein